MPEILRVYPNPWKAIDRDGLPCAVVPMDPEADGGGPGQFVGARVDRKRTKVLQQLEPHDNLRSARQKTTYEYLGIASNDPKLAEKLFATEPITLPKSRYYRERIREGALFAADQETAQKARARFVPAKDLAARFASLAPPQAESAASNEPPSLPADGTTTVTKPASGAPPLSAGESAGGFESAKGDEPTSAKRKRSYSI